MVRRTSSVIAFIWITTTCWAQRPCPVDVPVNVVLPNGSLIRRLGSQAFVAQRKDSSIPIASVSNETGPRRILLVVESGGRLRKVSREVAHIFLSELLANARSQDSFALLTVRGPRIEVPFGASRETVLAAVNDLLTPPKARKQPDIDDVIPEAVIWFKQPLPGDSIVLLTMGTDEERNTPHTKVAAALAANRVRLFGSQLGRLPSSGWVVVGGSAKGGLPPGSAIPLLTEGNITRLAEESGGFAFLENTEGDPWRQYKLTDERKLEIKRLAGQLYKGIIEYYVVRANSPAPEFQLDLADPVRKDLPNARVVYPRSLARCPSP